MSGHTKGPWVIHGGLQGYKGDVFSPTAKAVKDCHHIARCFAPKPSKQPLDELQLRQATNEAISVIEANARLIAAAPDLLEVCQEFVRRVDAGEVRSKRTYAAMKAAIAKAVQS